MVGTSNSFPEALITLRVSLDGSGPGGGWTGTAGRSKGSMSTPMGFTLVVDLEITGVVGVAGCPLGVGAITGTPP